MQVTSHQRLKDLCISFFSQCFVPRIVPNGWNTLQAPFQLLAKVVLPGRAQQKAPSGRFMRRRDGTLILLLLYRPGRSFVVDVFSPFAGYTSRPTDLTDRFHRVRFLGREGSSGGSIALDPVISFGPAAFPCIANELLVCVSISSVADQSPSRRNLDTHKEEKRNIINNNNNSEMANRFLGDEMEGETLGN